VQTSGKHEVWCHPHLETEKAWMPGTRPGMTTFGMTFLENR
jgi:hypothetical protein